MSRTGRTLIGIGVAGTLLGIVLTQATHRPASVLTTADPPPAVDTYSPPADPSPSPTDAVLSAADAAKQNDKGWVLETYRLHRDAAGSPQMTARIKNANDVESTAAFTATLLLNDETPLITWHGSAFKVPALTTVTVEMVTTDPVPPTGPGQVHLQFQVDSSVAD
jgi:hypothetical protein